MKLRVLGSFGPYPPAGGACSGFLIQDNDINILLDCGNGVLSRLQKHTDPWKLNAIVISHLHADHISDLFILRYALQMAQNEGLFEKNLDIYLPEEPVDESSRIPYKDIYKINYISSEKIIKINSFKVSFLETIHPVKCLAVKIESGGKILVYSGDTEYFQELVDFAAGADLFLCEANYQNSQTESKPKNHLSAEQAAEMAKKSKVKKLLLYHLPPKLDINISLKEAKKIFQETELAIEDSLHNI